MWFMMFELACARQVIERTAKFVHKEGKKMEAMLKVKHGGNAAFQFLLIDHPLQSYYQALLKYLGYCPQAADLPTLLPSLEQPQVEAEKPAENAAGATAVCADDAAASSGAETARAQAPAEADAAEACSEAVTQGDNGQGEDSSQVHAACKGNEVEAGPATDTAQEPDGAPAGGIPVPPPDMLQTIDKLVRWILKSGRDFEKKVKDRQRGDPRFDFLMPWNPYNAFYRQRLDDAFEGKLDEPAAAPEEGAAPCVSAAPAPTPDPEPKDEAGGSALPVAAEGAGSQDVGQPVLADAEAPAEAEDESNPKVQFITSFGEDSEGEEEQTGGGAESAAEAAASEHASAEEVPKKERSSRFGPDLSESEKKAARLARARQLAGLVKDKVDLEAKDDVESETKTADDKSGDKASNKSVRRSKSPAKKRSKSSSRSRRGHSRSRSRSPKRNRRRGHSRERESKSGSHRRRSRSRDRSGARKRSKRDRSSSRDRKRRRSSRSRSRPRDRDKGRDRDRDKGRRYDDGDVGKHKSRRRPSSSPRRKSSRRRGSSSSQSRSRSRPASRASKADALATGATSAPLEKAAVSKGATASPPRPALREGADESGAGDAESAVSDDLRNKVRAMLAAQLDLGGDK